MSGPRHAPPFALSGRGARRHPARPRARAGRTGRIQADSEPRLRRIRLAVERRGLAGPAGRARPRADQARPRAPLHQQRQCAAHRHAADAAHRQRQGPGAQAVGGGGRCRRRTTRRCKGERAVPFAAQARCYPGGVPGQLLFPFEPLYFIQTPKEVWMIWQRDHRCAASSSPTSIPSTSRRRGSAS